MSVSLQLETLELPPEVKRILGDFVQVSIESFGASLRSVVLFGSAAEGRLRATSDVNVILVLSAFEQGAADRIREPVRVAQAAVQLRPMFLLESEIGAAARGFAQKFADVARRRCVLYGEDPFASLVISRDIQLFQLRQQLLNLALRLRAFYVARSLREEQLGVGIADAAGPLRSCAAALLELEGHPTKSPKQALENVAASQGDSGWRELLALVSKARETRSLPPGTAGGAVFRLIELILRMRDRAERLS